MSRTLGTIIALLGILAAATSAAWADPPNPSARKVAVVASIDGMIDLGLGPFVERVLREAEEAGAELVILEVNTFGGRVDAAVAIRDHLLRSHLPTVAFVNKRAISAGALISLAAERIAMAGGGTIGAATPVQAGQPGEPSRPTDEKTVSYVRKEFRSTADARGRPGLIAEAMVDPDVEIPGLIAKGKLLTLTTAEALEHGVADLEAADLPDLLGKLGLQDAEVRRLKENWAEHTVRFLTHPALASLLLTLALLGIAIELRTPGFGIPGLVGLLSLASFFWGHWLVALVGWEQVLLVIGGIVLIIVEVFVLPGFGVAGILGFIALAAGLTTSLFGAGASLAAIVSAVSRVAISAALAVVASLALLRFVPRLPAGRKLILASALGGGGGRSEPDLPSRVGIVGTSVTPLRPAGIAELAGQRVDVVSEGEFVEAGEPVEVVRDHGDRVVVRLRRSYVAGRENNE